MEQFYIAGKPVFSTSSCTCSSSPAVGAVFLESVNSHVIPSVLIISYDFNKFQMNTQRKMEKYVYHNLFVFSDHKKIITLDIFSSCM